LGFAETARKWTLEHASESISPSPLISAIEEPDSIPEKSTNENQNELKCSTDEHVKRALSPVAEHQNPVKKSKNMRRIGRI
jgi:hypothetical protein